MLLRDLKSTISDDSVVFIQEGSGHPRFIHLGEHVNWNWMIIYGVKKQN